MGRKFRLAQTSLVAGELSPLMAARSDKPYNRNGAAALRNLAPLAQGGARTRPGLVYLATLGYSPTLLADFMFNLDQRYVFAFSAARLDIYSPAGAAVTALTSAPWTEAMMTDGKLTWTVSGDTMILCHPDMATQVIKRTGAATFTRAAFAFEDATAGQPRYQPYYKYADSAMTLTPSATTGNITLTLSAPGAWTAAHVGAIVRYGSKEILVTGYTSATVASGTVRETLGGTAASTDWDEATFNAARGYPACAAFFLNRLWLGGAKSYPRGVWASKVGAFFNFDLGSAADDEAIWDAVDYGDVRAMVGAERLIVFTDRTIFYVPRSTTTPLTATNYEFRPANVPFGISLVQPRVFDEATLFVQSTGAVVREARWDDVGDTYRTPSLSFLAEHLVSAPVALATLYGTSARPEQYALMLNGDTTLSVFHSIRDQDVAAWVPWETAGGDPEIKSICAVGEEVFVAVERTLDSTVVLTLEKFSDTAAPLDCSASDTVSPAGKTFTGFTHLANETVAVYSNGHYLGEHDVDAAGEIVLDDLSPAVTTIEAGFAFTQTATPMPVVFDLPDGESRGLVFGVTRTMIQVDRSASFAVDGDTILLDFVGDDYATAAPTVTGIVEVYHLGVDKDGQKSIVVSAPAKVTILGITREVEMGG